MTTADDFVKVAQQYVGYREKATNAQLDSKIANAGHANWNRFARDLKKVSKWSWLWQKSAWCCEFVSACTAEACDWDVKKTERLLGGSAEMSCNRLWNQMRNAGKTVFRRGNGVPKKGDFCFCNTKRLSVGEYKENTMGHIGLVEKVEGGYIHTIEGNSSDMVRRHKMKADSSRIYGYARPEWDATSTGTLKEVEDVTAKYLMGVDVSSHDVDSHKKHTDGVLDDKECGFVIVKATQGTTYTNPYHKQQIEVALKRGQKIGLYHYAAGGSAKKEAQFFYSKAKPWVGKATLWLDWESYQNKAWGSKSWCLTFLDELERLSGVRGGVYVQASALSQVANCASKSALWVAGYPVASRDSWTAPKYPYGTGAWKTWSIWQYTSAGGTDRNTSRLTAEAWDKLAAPAKKASSSKRTYRVIVDVLNIRSDASAASTKKGRVLKGYEFSTATRKLGKDGRYWAKTNSGWMCLGKEGNWYVKRIK